MLGLEWLSSSHENTLLVLIDIINLVDNEDILWYTSCLDRIDPLYCLLENKAFTGQSLVRILKEYDDILEITVKAYPKKDFSISLPFNDIKNTNTYRDFLNSPCLISYYCYDSCYQDVYTKDLRLLNNIRKILIKHEATSIFAIMEPDEYRSWF